MPISESHLNNFAVRKFKDVEPGDKVCFFSQDGEVAILGTIRTVKLIENDPVFGNRVRWEYEIIATNQKTGFKDRTKSAWVEVKI